MGHDLEVTWNMFDAAIKDLAAKLKSEDYVGVYGIPRGGLPLAVALSHALNLPFLKKPTEGCLVVDEICDTGKTLKRYVRKYVCATMYDLYEASCHPHFAWMRIPAPYIGPHRQWIKFPWEVKVNG